MSEHHTLRYELIVNNLPADRVDLVRFSGVESLNQLFEFDIYFQYLLGEDEGHDLSQLDDHSLIEQNCQLVVYQGDHPVRKIYGVLAEVEEYDFQPNAVLFCGKLVPAVWQLTHFETNEVYLNQNIKEIISTVMQEFDLTETIDYRFDLSSEILASLWEFKLQYQETHLQFIQRICERDGIAFYFEQNDSQQQMRLVFTDKSITATKLPAWYQSAGMRASGNSGYITHFVRRSKRLPRAIRFRDYNPEQPNLDIVSETEIDSSGVGCINLYGLNIRDNDEAQRLARAHAQSYKVTKHQFIGEGMVPAWSAGAVVEIENHPRSNYNNDFLVVELHTSGENPQHKRSNNPQPVFHARFTTVSAEQRWVRTMSQSTHRVTGNLHAIIESDGSSGNHPLLDTHGRYKVRLPFDRKNSEQAQASHWIAMAQPFGGPNEGMHFPLRAGTHVLLSFIGGDPDRPVIASTLADAVHQTGPVINDNHTNKIIKTAQGNKIEIEDQEDKRRIKLESPHSNTYMHLGAANAAGDGIVALTDGMYRQVIRAGTQVTQTVINAEQTISDTTKEFDAQSPDTEAKSALEQRPHNLYIFPHIGFDSDTNKPVTLGLNDDDTAVEGEASVDSDLEGITPVAALTEKLEISGQIHTYRRQGDYFHYTVGNEFYFGGGAVVSVGNGFEENHVDGGTLTDDHACDFIDQSAVGVQLGQRAENGDITPPNPIPLANMLVERTIGDSYTYTKGHTTEVSVGPYEEHFLGDGETPLLGLTMTDSNNQKIEQRESYKVNDDNKTISDMLFDTEQLKIEDSMTAASIYKAENLSSPGNIDIYQTTDGQNVNETNDYDSNGDITLTDNIGNGFTTKTTREANLKGTFIRDYENLNASQDVNLRTTVSALGGVSNHTTTSAIGGANESNMIFAAAVNSNTINIAGAVNDIALNLGAGVNSVEINSGLFSNQIAVFHNELEMENKFLGGSLRTSTGTMTVDNTLQPLKTSVSAAGQTLRTVGTEISNGAVNIGRGAVSITNTAAANIRSGAVSIRNSILHLFS